MSTRTVRIRVAKDLAGSCLLVAPGDILVITEDGGGLWAGTGGAADPQLAPFTKSSQGDDMATNASFTFTGSGTTTVWVTDQQGHRAEATVLVTETAG